MANIEDKILGIKLENYCSSSDEDQGSSGEEDDKYIATKPKPYEFTGMSQQTGPKGVIEDFKDFKKFTEEQKALRDRELAQSLEKTAFSSLSLREEDMLNNRINDISRQVEDEMDDDDKEFFEKYKQKKMKELISNISSLPTFGNVVHLQDGNEYINAVDNENPLVNVVIFIYNETNVLCQYITSLLDSMAKSYPHIKFCSINANTPGISQNFSIQGVPAVLVYKNGELIGNFVRLQDSLNKNFGFRDLETFFKQNGVLSTATI